MQHENSKKQEECMFIPWMLCTATDNFLSQKHAFDGIRQVRGNGYYKHLSGDKLKVPEEFTLMAFCFRSLICRLFEVGIGLPSG